MNNLAIIPARSGSKGLPDKNIKLLNDLPLMAHSINSAIKSNVFSEIMVSTDSVKYKDIAIQNGASVPFIRSEENSSDTASSWDMVKEVIEQYKQIGKTFDTICLLQPTSPLRTPDDIINAYKLFYEKEAFSVVSVCEMDHSPIWSNTLSKDYSLNGFLNRENCHNRQKYEPYYRVNGVIYIVKPEELFLDDFLYREGCYAYVMPAGRSVDIDTEKDFEYADYLFQTIYK